jgi:hypothetical protein
MKIIFLDFDGVLTNRKTRFGSADPVCVASLNKITFATGAEIVVSSTWRMQGLDAIRHNLFLWGVLKTPIDVTPRLQSDSATRGSEIRQWLVEHPGTNRFVILDDDADMDDLREHLVKCDTNIGLTPELANFVIQKLL